MPARHGIVLLRTLPSVMQGLTSARYSRLLQAKRKKSSLSFSTSISEKLAAALWSAQYEIYGSGSRRPYIVTGVYPQCLRGTRHDVIDRIASRLARTLAALKSHLTRVDPNDQPRVKMVKEAVAYYEREVTHFREI